MFAVYSGSTRVMGGFKERTRAEAYCAEWRNKAGRTDLHVVIEEDA